MELKLFDDYEGRPGSTVAIIETYDGYYQEHCFCSTSITLPNQSPKSKDKLRY